MTGPSQTPYHIAVPSYRRAGKVLVFDSFPQATLYVPASQAREYAEYYGEDKLVVVPDDQDGCIARKRNYILDHAPCEQVLMIDDDVLGVGVWEGDLCRQLSPTECAALIERGFEHCRGAGTVLWGINIIKDKRAYSVFRPFGLLAPIPGPWQGHILPHGLRYDERMGAKEDYDLWLQAIERYRKTFRFNKYHYIKYEQKQGGIYAQRTAEREQAWAEAIERKWGGVIRYRSKRKNLLDPRITIPIPGC